MRAGAFDHAIGDWAPPPPHPRFGVYRNNVVSALINALRVRYPVAEELAGAEFFAAMASHFAARHRPASPLLIGYGDNFADFIDGFAPAASFPCLADVARLESLWWRAYHSADADPLPPAALAAVAPEAWAQTRFQFHPSTELLASPFAIASIWEARRGGVAAGQAEWVLVARPFAGVEVRRLGVEAHDFLKALFSGMTLGGAAGLAAELHPGFDLSGHLAALIGLNIITGLAT